MLQITVKPRKQTGARKVPHEGFRDSFRHHNPSNYLQNSGALQLSLKQHPPNNNCLFRLSCSKDSLNKNSQVSSHQNVMISYLFTSVYNMSFLLTSTISSVGARRARRAAGGARVHCKQLHLKGLHAGMTEWIIESQGNLSSILGQLHEASAFTDTVALRFGAVFALARKCAKRSQTKDIAVLCQSTLLGRSPWSDLPGLQLRCLRLPLCLETIRGDEVKLRTLQCSSKNPAWQQQWTVSFKFRCAYLYPYEGHAAPRQRRRKNGRWRFSTRDEKQTLPEVGETWRCKLSSRLRFGLALGFGLGLGLCLLDLCKVEPHTKDADMRHQT